MQRIANLHPFPAPEDAGAGLRVNSRVRVGIDLTETTQVEAAILRYGDRYERRLYTDAERGDATGAPAVRAASLAARFAAKEAVLKVLASGDPPPWQSIEIRREPGKAPELHLYGQAAELAAEAGLYDWSVSLTHDRGMAGAIVAAMVTGHANADERTNNEEPQ